MLIIKLSESEKPKKPVNDHTIYSNKIYEELVFGKTYPALELLSLRFGVYDSFICFLSRTTVAS